MKIQMISLLICVSLNFLSLSAGGDVIGSEWFAETSNVIHMRCDGLDHDVEIAWTKLGKLALSILNTTMADRVKLTNNAYELDEYNCIAQIYDTDDELVTAVRLTLHPQSHTRKKYKKRREYAKLPKESKINCQSADSEEPDLFFDWSKSIYSPVSHRTTVFGSFTSIPELDSDTAKEYTCSGWSPSEIGCSAVQTNLISIKPPKVKLIQPYTKVHEGANTGFYCIVTEGDQPVITQWYTLEGDSLGHKVGIGAMLNFDNITFTAAGQYICVATNEAGTAEAVAEVGYLTCPPVKTQYWQPDLPLAYRIESSS